MNWIKKIFEKKEKVVEEVEKPKIVCPNCGSEEYRTIVYGLISFKNDDDEANFYKEHVMGGCILSKDNPHYSCNKCHTRF